MALLRMLTMRLVFFHDKYYLQREHLLHQNGDGGFVLNIDMSIVVVPSSQTKS